MGTSWAGMTHSVQAHQCRETRGYRQIYLMHPLPSDTLSQRGSLVVVEMACEQESLGLILAVMPKC